MSQGRASVQGVAVPAEKVELAEFLSRYGTVVALVVVFVTFSALSPQFLTVDNLINVLRQVSTLAIVTAGLTVCIAAGEFDLAVGSVASLSGILVSGLIVRQEQPAWAAIAVALASGVAFGLLNGVLVSWLRIPSIITTMGTSSVAVGVNFAYAGGDSIYGRFPDEFRFIGQGFVGPIPFAVILAVVIVICLAFFLDKTRPGRYIVATGGNPTAARLIGINVSRYRLLALLICSLCAALAGVVLTSYLGTGQPLGGQVYTLMGLAAVFLGMTTIRPGQANMPGTVVGVLILGILSNGLNLVGAPFYLQEAIRGLILVLSVALAVVREEIRFF
ncbi:MAG TPA: ABC transporter permease [Chloroflexota bacterium]